MRKKKEKPALKATQRKVLEWLAVDPGFTLTRIANGMVKSLPTIKRAAKVLKEKGYISREGSDKTGTWVVHKTLED